MSLVLDYAWARPTVSELLRVDAVGVVRYLSHDATKSISTSELESLRAAGLGVALVFEDGARNFAGGYTQGVDDGQFAAGECARLGLPPDCPIYTALDDDVIGLGLVNSADHYLAGWAVGIGSHRPGVYGGYDVVLLPRVRGWYRWQTTAWSRGHIAPGLHLYQNGGLPPLANTDTNTAYGPDWGQITPGKDTTPVNAPTLLLRANDTGRIFLAVTTQAGVRAAHIGAPATVNDLLRVGAVELVYDHQDDLTAEYPLSAGTVALPA